MKCHKLYYNLSKTTPLYPGTPRVQIRKQKCLKDGDSCNTYTLVLSNHCGTHIDAPRHFFNSGKTISDFCLASLFFRNPFILRCPKKNKELIDELDLQVLKGKKEVDFLIIMTGFSKLRSKSPNFYIKENPCLTPEAAEWLKRNFPNLRGIGIDTISVSSRSHPDLGRQVHRILLGNGKRYFGRSILIVEDMFIPRDIKKIDEFIILPFFIDGVDSVPCSCIGINYD